MSEKQDKKLEDMRLVELLDELIDCAKSQKVNQFFEGMRMGSKHMVEARALALARRIDEIRDEIARRVGS